MINYIYVFAEHYCLFAMTGSFISMAIKNVNVVIPAKAEIQELTGCPRLKHMPVRLIKPGMT